MKRFWIRKVILFPTLQLESTKERFQEVIQAMQQQIVSYAVVIVIQYRVSMDNMAMTIMDMVVPGMVELLVLGTVLLLLLGMVVELHKMSNLLITIGKKYLKNSVIVFLFLPFNSSMYFSLVFLFGSRRFGEWTVGE